VAAALQLEAAEAALQLAAAAQVAQVRKSLGQAVGRLR
jgi:hypothetical protein